MLGTDLAANCVQRSAGDDIPEGSNVLGYGEALDDGPGFRPESGTPATQLGIDEVEDELSNWKYVGGSIAQVRDEYLTRR